MEQAIRSGQKGVLNDVYEIGNSSISFVHDGGGDGGGDRDRKQEE